MSEIETRIILTGFMGVGKSTVARHLAYFLQTDNHDLDDLIESDENRRVSEIINEDGEEAFREIETANLKRILERESRIISLGGGAWTIDRNRKIIKEHNYTSVWLESTFSHCWRNIRLSKRDRPLARNKAKARKLFDERQRFYCLADWHFVIKPGFDSRDIARGISSDVFA